VVSFAISIQKNSPGRLPGSFNSQLCHSLSSRSYRVLPGPTGHGNVGCIGSIWHGKWDTLGRYMRKFLQRGPLLTHIFEYLQVSKAKMCSQLPSGKKKTPASIAILKNPSLLVLLVHLPSPFPWHISPTMWYSGIPSKVNFAGNNDDYGNSL